MKKIIAAALTGLFALTAVPALAADKKADAKTEKKAEKKAEKKK